ncbi:MAG: tryptophan 2,3-dioxygenase family protein [Bacteroidota bacterium]|nr:tryptophan 2,3-dioxygenase family protein [Bacteroidota bacterium]
METNQPIDSYSGYLHLDRLLDCQRPRSGQAEQAVHDEMLFIITHQSCELWFKQILHDMRSVADILHDVPSGSSLPDTAVVRSRRIAAVVRHLTDQCGILETMDPCDYADFRGLLYPISAFQSVQFRKIEILFGVRREQQVLYDGYAHSSRIPVADRDELRRMEEEPTLFDRVQSWLERLPFLEVGGYSFRRAYQDAVRRMLGREREAIRENEAFSALEKQKYLVETSTVEERFDTLFDPERYREIAATGRRRFSHRAMLAALFIMVYHDRPRLQTSRRLLDALIDIDEALALWRYHHALMAHRMIGEKIGSGGSSGFHYLKSTAENRRVYTDLTALATYLIPRTDRPALDPHVLHMLDGEISP